MTVTIGGYVLIRMPDHPNAYRDGYVRRSHLVLSEYLGRPIAPYEVVHHINGIKDDDRAENLIALTISDHTALHHEQGDILHRH